MVATRILCQSGSKGLLGLALVFQSMIWNGSYYVWMRLAVSLSALHISKPIYAMLGPVGNSFHPSRRIGQQGDTPSTLVFIAVINILLTLLESSSSEIAYTYADDLIHLSHLVDLQQCHADLVCGFCALTGLEISCTRLGLA